MIGPLGQPRGVDMPSNYAAPILLTAGTITFANEWLQTGEVNWRVPIATLLAAGTIGSLGAVAPGAANALAVMALIAALSTKFNGRSAIGEIGSALPQKSKGN